MPRPEAGTDPHWRERRLTAGALALVTLVAVAYTALGPGMRMSAFEMTAMAGPFGALDGAAAVAMAPPEWTPAYAAAVLLMWSVMMVAMMLPSAAPMVLLYGALRARLGRPRRLSIAMLSAGYLACWIGFAIAVTLLQWGLEREGLVAQDTMALTGQLLGGAVLIAAGVWQLTPAKRACLRLCRNPAAVLAGRIGGGAGAAFRLGLEQGAYCLGCCWALMALLFAGGIMNLWWILGLALVVLVEKLWALGEVFARVVGVGLILWGGWLLAGAAAV